MKPDSFSQQIVFQHRKKEIHKVFPASRLLAMEDLDFEAVPSMEDLAFESVLSMEVPAFEAVLSMEDLAV